MDDLAKIGGSSNFYIKKKSQRELNGLEFLFCRPDAWVSALPLPGAILSTELRVAPMNWWGSPQTYNPQIL